MRIMKCGILLILILALGLTGCHSLPVATTPPVETTVAPTEPTFPRPEEKPLDLTEPEPYQEGEKEVTCRLLPETLDNPENLPVLKWVCFCTSFPDDLRIYVSYGEKRQWSEEAADEINAMLAAYDLPFRIQFMLFTTDNEDVKDEDRVVEIDWFRVPEVRTAMAEADLITGAFTQAEAIRYLMPITEYVAEDSAVSLGGLVPHEINWKLATWEDEVYGVPTILRYPKTNGWHVVEKVFTEYGFTAEDFEKGFLEMDEIFAEIYEKNGQKGFLRADSITSSQSWYDGTRTIVPGVLHMLLGSRYQLIGDCYAVDYSSGTPVIVNYLETEYVRQILGKMLVYAQKGYYAYEYDYEEALIDYTICYSASNYEYTEKFNYFGKTTNVCVIPAETINFGINPSDMWMTSILKGSRQSELVLRLLETMGEEEAFRKQLLFGREGTDYTVVDGNYQSLSRQDGTYNMHFLSDMDAFCGFSVDTYGSHKRFLPEAEGMTRLETYQTNVEQSQIWAPVRFNWSEMGTEYLMIEQALKKYCVAQPFTSDHAYDAMLAELRELGGDRVKRELQRQLDEWFAENPEWLELCKPDKTEN